MKIKLYECFKHWLHGGAIYLYSDPHFNDNEQLKLLHKKLDDESQIKSINKVVGKLDTIIFLGDIGDKSCISKIRGYKVAILGNHDKGSSYYRDVFDEVYDGPVLINSKIILSHEPLKYDFAFNIHGHDHGKKSFQDNMHMNLCAELINYMPISLKSIFESGKLKDVPDIHRTAIDSAIKNKLPKIN